MVKKDNGIKRYSFHPLTPDRWDDVERLFGVKGACAGCWCMWWRITRSRFEKQKGSGNKRTFKKIVLTGEIPGIIAYAGGKPVGWCSVASRESFPVLERSRILKRVDDKPVWSVVCFFIPREYRRKGLSVALLQAVIDYARSKGGKIIEGYPVEPKKDTMPDAFAWTGIAAAFRKVGFSEVARRSETRPIMRYYIA